MQAVLTGDLHIHPWRDCSRDSGLDRLADGLMAMEQTLSLAEAKKCAWVFEGDLKMHRWMWPQEALNGVLAVLEKFPKVPKLMFPGQHDGVGKQNGTGLRPFAKHALVIEQPTILPKETFGWNVATVVWPWTVDLGGLPAFLEQARTAGAQTIFSHAFLDGAKVGPLDLRLQKGISLEAFGLTGERRVFKWGFFGDIHKQQQVVAMRVDSRKVYRAEVWYVGSPYSQNWGELERRKGCLFVDFTGGLVTPVNVDAPNYRIVDWSEKDNKVLGTFCDGTEIAGESLDDWTGNFVRFIVGSWALPELLKTIEGKAQARSLAIVVRRQKKTEMRSPVHAGMPVKQLLSEYVKSRPPEEGLEPQAVLLAGEKLMEGTA